MANEQYDHLRALGRDVDLDMAISCVELSELAYKPPPRGEELTSSMGYRGYRWLSRRDHRDYVFIVSDERYHYVVFRGSDDRLDWLTNLSIWTTNSPYGPVHRGYYAVSRAFLPELAAIINELPQRPIMFTGHSMGGSLAVICGVAMADQDLPVAGVYTYGQPKTGRRQFTEYVASHLTVPYYRFVHGADAIAAWGRSEQSMLGNACYFDIHGQLQYGRHLREFPRLTLRSHRLEHYRYFLRLNRLKLRALNESSDAEDATQIQ